MKGFAVYGGLMLVLLFALVAGATAVASANDSSCVITNVRAGAMYTNIDAAVAGASGDTFTVRGTCLTNDFPENDFHVTLVGVGPNPTIAIAPTADLPIINGGFLEIRNLTLTEVNKGAPFGEIVYNTGTLIMDRNSVITGAFGAPGVMNFGILAMNSNSRISGNTNNGSGQSAAFGGYGGGVYNFTGATMFMNDRSRITGNTAAIAGGGVYNDTGVTFQMNGHSRVVGNSPDNIFNES